MRRTLLLSLAGVAATALPALAQEPAATASANGAPAVARRAAPAVAMSTPPSSTHAWI